MQLDSDFKFKKKYGQNFISDKNFLMSLINLVGVDEEDNVLEIGAGSGNLTSMLATKAKKVLAYEIDKTLKPMLDIVSQNNKNVEIIFADALKTNIKEIEKNFEGNYKVVANLPYYITTPLIFKFLEETNKIISLSIMVQKEVADRIVSDNKSKNYGALTLAIKYYGEAKIIKNVSRKMFYPVPNVDSSFVKIELQKNKYKCNKELFFKIINSAFARRRKTLINNISLDFGLTKDDIKKILNSINISEYVRGEELSINDFVNLTNCLEKL